MLNEIWKPVCGLEGHYSVSDLGRVRGDKVRTNCVHVLALEAFRGPRPEGFQGAHDDNNRANPVLGNLRWATCVGNNADKVRHGTHNRGERHFLSVLTEEQVASIRAAKSPQDEIAARFGIGQSTVSKIRAGKRWPHSFAAQPVQQLTQKAG